MRRSCLAFAVVVAIGFMVQPSLAGTIINGGFETGDLTGWSCQTDNGASVTVETGGAVEGTHYARLYAPGPSDAIAHATLSQEFDAVAGDRLSFSYLDRGLGQISETAKVSPGNIYLSIGPYNSFNTWGEWTQARFWCAGDYEFCYEFPSSGHYTLSVYAEALSTVGGEVADLGIDDVKLTPAPEPSTFCLFGIAAVGFLVRARRRRRRV
jgi:hypothetical protein